MYEPIMFVKHFSHHCYTYYSKSITKHTYFKDIRKEVREGDLVVLNSPFVPHFILVQNKFKI